ncbi:hypothetical protein FHP25_13275 [Vineibacter terrae]|uniref:Uncharacterized protein n=1 Tax=Vineibacter terrae TaxID=2586908 RepID=A0A5C8PNL9_9HYPH|nr:hypothetical protein [Vineibacter terrae]TXL75621.1 hypothetical protein FHP25_13275 [Vineibacter terrae]
MTASMLGETRLLEYFKSERDRLLWHFASGNLPPEREEVEYLATIQVAIQAVEGLIADGGLREIGGEKPTAPFMSTGKD